MCVPRALTMFETPSAKIFSAKFESACGAVAYQLDNHIVPAMLASALTLLLILYLLVGAVLCVRGRLAVKITYETAIVAAYGGTPAWKVIAYRWALRAGVVVAWLAFLTLPASSEHQ